MSRYCAFVSSYLLSPHFIIDGEVELISAFVLKKKKNITGTAESGVEGDAKRAGRANQGTEGAGSDLHR